MLKKLLLYLVVSVILTFAGAILYIKLALPRVGDAPKLKVELTAERVKHGEYLANAVAACMDCHSKRDWSKFAGPLVPGTLGQGGERFNQDFGFPGDFYSKNITPAGIGNWTDGEVLRAITSGVNKEGKALFPVMPHPAYGKLDVEDIKDIIAYLRQLPSIKNEVPESKPDFPMSVIINTIPAKASFSKRPNENNKIEYGKYLFTMASCRECHTKQEKGKPIMELDLAGGFEFPLGNGVLVRSANITPDKETGIGNLTEADFVSRFKRFADSAYVDATIKPGGFNTLMPWKMYGQMKESDLKAIFAYLQTVKPIKNEVL